MINQSTRGKTPKKISKGLMKRLTDNMGLVLVSSDNKEVTKNAENKEEETTAEENSQG